MKSISHMYKCVCTYLDTHTHTHTHTHTLYAIDTQTQVASIVRRGYILKKKYIINEKRLVTCTSMGCFLDCSRRDFSK